MKQNQPKSRFQKAMMIDDTKVRRGIPMTGNRKLTLRKIIVTCQPNRYT
jgi:hypothetical protein